MWNDWYNEYIHVADFPRVIVRYEDLIFHPHEVVRTVCECAGGELNRHKFRIIEESAKRGVGAHGDFSQRTGYVDALIKYGDKKTRIQEMSDLDLDYAKKNLDPELMGFFGYQHPSKADIEDARANTMESKMMELLRNQQ
jgi:hypothetical protein